MIDKRLLFSMCKKCFFDDAIVKSYNQITLTADKVRALLNQRKQIVSREELGMVRDFVLKSIGTVNHPDVLSRVALSNADYDFYFALKDSQEETEKILTFRSLREVSKLSAYSILATTYPLEYSFISNSTCTVVSALCLDGENKWDSDSKSVGFEKSIYEKTNSYFCDRYKEAGFQSASEFSVYIIALYRYMYHKVQPRRRNNLSTEEMVDKISHFIAHGCADQS